MSRFRTIAADQRRMDMTSMVDVVFLLLIFFMITASFTLQKAIQQPPVDLGLVGYHDFDQTKSNHVEILIDQHNTYQISSYVVGVGYSPYIEAASDQEMRVRLRELLARGGCEVVKIFAHGNATNEKVITAWDASMDNGISEISSHLTLNQF